MSVSPFSGQKVRAEGLSGKRTTEVGELLGGGGEGGVYRDCTRPDYVLKIMHQSEARVERKIQAMLATAPELQVERETDGDGNSIVQIAWPQEILYDLQGRFCGFSMRLLETTKTVPLNAWFDPRSRGRNNLSQSDLVRIYLAANLASVTEYINLAGHSVIDFKPQNILAYREHGYVCLLDCDGFLIRSGSEVFPAAVVTPSFLAPEHHHNFDPRRLDENQDRFALAVMAYMLLDNGRHPASGSSPYLPDDQVGRLAKGAVFLDPASGLTPPDNSHYEFFPDETLTMFRLAFIGPVDPRLEETFAEAGDRHGAVRC